MTLTHHGGVDIEEFDKSLVASVPFDPLTGLKAFVVANALSALGAPKQIISPLVQHLPKLWEAGGRAQVAARLGIAGGRAS